MTLLEQLNAWQEEIQELKDQCSNALQGLSRDIEEEIVSCATAVSSARNMAAGRSPGQQIIPRAGQSERRIDLSVRSYLETNACGVIRRTNNATALLLNFPRHLLVGQPLLVFIQKEERKAFLSAFLELRHGPKAKRHEYLVMIHPVSLEPQLAMLVAERIEDPDHNVFGITWLLAPA
ncbi:MAG TPA: hypothetical protein VFI05_05800 [Nitrospiraceae bacterium]|nr:hypothetical protein [Nitrospiraceae bacterium]